MTMKIALRRGRAPKFGAGKIRWPKISEPGSLCEKAGLRMQKHEPNPLTWFGQSLRPFHGRLRHIMQELGISQAKSMFLRQ